MAAKLNLVYFDEVKLSIFPRPNRSILTVVVFVGIGDQVDVDETQEDNEERENGDLIPSRQSIQSLVQSFVWIITTVY